MVRDDPFDDDRDDDDYEDLFRSLARFLEEIMEGEFDQQMGPGQSAQNHHIDKRETDDNIIFIMDVPGYEDSEISVEPLDDRVTIEGETTRRGRTTSFDETLPVPSHVEPDDIEVTVNNGIIEVTIPKQGPSNVGFQ